MCEGTRKKFSDLAYTETGEHKCPTINAAYLSMTCEPVVDKDWMVPYKCTLGNCNNSPKLQTAASEDVKVGLGQLNKITYKENCVAYSCPTHGPIGYESKCSKCEQ